MDSKINSSKNSISKLAFLDLLSDLQKDSKEFLEVGKQFCEFIKNKRLIK